MEKRIMILVGTLLCNFYVNGNMLGDLADAVKNLDVDKTKEILANKAHEFNKHELQSVKDSMRSKAKKPLIVLMWYQNYRSLAKIGFGAAGLFFAGKFAINALANNPEENVSAGTWLQRFFSAQVSQNPQASNSRAVSTSLCLASGAVGALSAVALVKGIKEVRRYQKKSRVYALSTMIDKALA